METNKVTCIMIADDNVNWANMLEKYLQQNIKNIQFENMVERVVIGEINENGEKIPNVIRFVLKTGESYVEIFTKKKEKLCRQKPAKKMELNGSENVTLLYCTS